MIKFLCEYMHVYIFACVIDCNGIDIMHSICTGAPKDDRSESRENDFGG